MSIACVVSAVGLTMCALAASSEPFVVRAGADADAIQQAVRKASQCGGGVVRIEAGKYTLTRALDFSNLKHIRILGSPGTVLKAGEQVMGSLAEPAEKGATCLVLEAPMALHDGEYVEIHSDGRRVTPPGRSDSYVVPYIMGQVERAEGRTLHLTHPLRYAAPAGKRVIGVFNGIVVRGDASDITIHGVTIDMNRDAWPIAPKNHAYHCGVWAQGSYSYEKGPTGPPVNGLRIVNCTVQNAHHRGIAFYSVTNSGVYDSRIKNTSEEGIDFDHFAYHCQAVGNTVVDCRNIELNDASDCVIAHNRIERPASGIVVWQWCTQSGLNERNLILGNTILDAKNEGIRLCRNADDNLIVGNTVLRSAGVGIGVDGAGNVITGNRSASNKKGDLSIAGTGNVSTGNKADE